MCVCAHCENKNEPSSKKIQRRKIFFQVSGPGILFISLLVGHAVNKACKSNPHPQALPSHTHTHTPPWWRWLNPWAFNLLPKELQTKIKHIVLSNGGRRHSQWHPLFRDQTRTRTSQLWGKTLKLCLASLFWCMNSYPDLVRGFLGWLLKKAVLWAFFSSFCSHSPFFPFIFLFSIIL